MLRHKRHPILRTDLGRNLEDLLSKPCPFGPRVVIVGNGPSLHGSSLGSKIDEFEYVVRINSFETEGHEADAGTKITHWMLNAPVLESVQLVEERHWSYVRDKIIVMHLGRRKMLQHLFEKDQPRGARLQVVDTMCQLDIAKKYGAPPSTGVVTCNHFIRQLEPVYICGFDILKGKDVELTHYYENREIAFSDPEVDATWLKEKIALGWVKELK